MIELVKQNKTVAVEAPTITKTYVDGEVKKLQATDKELKTYVDGEFKKLQAADKELKQYTNNTFANALKAHKVGEMVSISDASPVEHDIKISVKRKNLINESTFYDAANWNINIYHAGAYYHGFYKLNLKENTQYTFSWDCEGDFKSQFQISKYAKGTEPRYGSDKAVVYISVDNTVKKTVTFTTESGMDYGFFVSATYQSVFDVQYFLDNAVKWVQIEQGKTATSYAPYIEDLSSVSLLKYGTNLFDATQPRIRAYLDYNLMLFSDDSWSVAIPCEPNKTYYVCHANEANTIFRIGYIKQTPQELEEVIKNGGTTPWQAYAVKRKTTEKQLTITTGEGATFVVVQITAAQAPNTITTLCCCDYFTSYEISTDGIANGISTDYPITTIGTDTIGAIVETEYNKDINKAFAELQNAMISMGANI
jgi:hypothetical protein